MMCAKSYAVAGAVVGALVAPRRRRVIGAVVGGALGWALRSYVIVDTDDDGETAPLLAEGGQVIEIVPTARVVA